jgi:transcriptional regulator with XRE-family HTH domain
MKRNAINNAAIIDHRTIGQRIREEREKLALSRAEFAEIIELSDYYVGQLERGERQMSLSVLFKVSSCLHISLDYLVLGTSRYAEYSASNETAPAYANENAQLVEIMQLLEKCSEKELDLIKKLIQTIIPYMRQYETKSL